MFDLYFNVKILLVLLVFFGCLSSGNAGVCWLKRMGNNKCKDAYSKNTTWTECCGGTSKGAGYTQKELSEVEFFFATAIDGGATCASCVESCENASCGPNKKCVIRKGRPKCICSLLCKGSKNKNKNGQNTNLVELGTKFSNSNPNNKNNNKKNKNNFNLFNPKPNRLTLSHNNNNNKKLNNNSNNNNNNNQRKRRIELINNSDVINNLNISSNNLKSDKLIINNTLNNNKTLNNLKNNVRHKNKKKNHLNLNNQSNNNKFNSELISNKTQLINFSDNKNRRKENRFNLFMNNNNNKKTFNKNNSTIRNHQKIGLEEKIRSGYFNSKITQEYNLNFQEYYSNLQNRGPYYNPVCGTDGKTYKTECQLKKRACRQNDNILTVAYRGHCQTSCRFVKCTTDKHCLEDQNSIPHCVQCVKKCPSDGKLTPSKQVCGVDGITYPSLCHLKLEGCSIGREIPAAYRGSCVDAANCSNVKCRDRQVCLTDLITQKPRCVSCSFKCPRKRRPQGIRAENSKVCGTNNNTYYSWCHMMKDSCHTKFYIDAKYSGSCQKDESSSNLLLLN